MNVLAELKAFGERQARVLGFGAQPLEESLAVYR